VWPTGTTQRPTRDPPPKSACPFAAIVLFRTTTVPRPFLLVRWNVLSVVPCLRVVDESMKVPKREHTGRSEWRQSRTGTYSGTFKRRNKIGSEPGGARRVVFEPTEGNDRQVRNYVNGIRGTNLGFTGIRRERDGKTILRSGQTVTEQLCYRPHSNGSTKPVQLWTRRRTE